MQKAKQSKRPTREELQAKINTSASEITRRMNEFIVDKKKLPLWGKMSRVGHL